MASLIFEFASEHVWDIAQAVLVCVGTAVITPLLMQWRQRRINRRAQGRG